MSSGKTTSRQSGKIIGVHQKIDRAARRNLNLLIKNPRSFPGIRSIIYFEGKNGPDGLKIKHSKKDNPWHFINPLIPDDRALIIMIDDHIFNLSEAIRAKNDVRAAFEAAWLAHAVTDGLTPAHLVPLGDEIEGLFGYSPRDEKSYLNKKIIRGKNRRDTLMKNWKYWCDGMVMSHFMFEVGVASAIAPKKYLPVVPSEADIDYLMQKGFENSFLKSVKKIYALKAYEDFIKNGMTVDLALEIKETIVPEIINCVTLAWYQAVLLAAKK